MDFEEFEQAWKMVVSKFDLCEDGLLRNSRLEAVRSRQEEISSKRSNAGIAGVFAKANASANGQAKSKQRKEKKKEKIEEEVGRVVTTSKTLFSQCRYTNIELVREALPELVAEGVNLEHYLDAISNWSDTKDERRSDRGWLATFRQWAKTDRDKGELKKAGAPANGKPAWNPRG